MTNEKEKIMNAMKADYEQLMKANYEELDFGQIEECKDCFFYIEKEGVQFMNVHGCIWCNKFHRINYWQPIYKHEEE